MAFYSTHNERVRMLKAMDLIARSFNDEELEFVWLMGGVPDGADEDDFGELADDEKVFEDCVRLFSALIQSDEYKESGLFY